MEPERPDSVVLRACGTDPEGQQRVDLTRSQLVSGTVGPGGRDWWSSNSIPVGANPRVGLGFALKEAEAGCSRRKHCQDDACSTRRRRLAMQPPTFAEGSKFDARGGIPPACSIAGAKCQGGILVAVGNP
jgi:hypothetical protein